MQAELELIRAETLAVLREYYKAVQPQPGQILVVGCSTSEVGGASIGTAGPSAIRSAAACAIVRSVSGERPPIAA